MTDSVQLYKPFKRLFNGPADVDTIFNSYEEALLHAKSNTAYNGEVLKVVTSDRVFMYTVFNGELLKIPVDFVSKDIDRAISTIVTQKENGIEISTKLKISSKDGNIITLTEDGLYATVQNIDIIPSNPGKVPNDVARKYIVNIGDNFSKDVVINHNLNVPRVNLTIWTNKTPSELVLCDVSIIDNNSLTIHFDEIPTKDEYSVVIVG